MEIIKINNNNLFQGIKMMRISYPEKFMKTTLDTSDLKFI